MLLRLIQRVAKRLVRGAPRVPNAPASGRSRPERRSDWQPTDAPVDPPPAGPVDDTEETDGSEAEVDTDTLKAWLTEGRNVVFVDIREPYELRSGWIAGALRIPMNSVPQRLEELPQDATLAVYCAAGVRSFGVAWWLREQGFEDAWSVVGGAGACADAGGSWTTEGE